MVLAKQQFNLRGREVAEPHARFVPFTAQTRMSGVDFFDEAERADSGPRTRSPKAAVETVTGQRAPEQPHRSQAFQRRRPQPS